MPRLHDVSIGLEPSQAGIDARIGKYRRPLQKTEVDDFHKQLIQALAVLGGGLNKPLPLKKS